MRYMNRITGYLVMACCMALGPLATPSASLAESADPARSDDASKVEDVASRRDREQSLEDDSSSAHIELEEFVVVGTRRDEHSLRDAPVPLQVVRGEALATQGSTDLDDLLRATVLSYNVQRHGIDDEATLVRPATLRGLPPDAALLLVNEKRRHRSAIIAFLGSSLNSGSQGPDLFVIPSIAIDRVEVLHDGAGAQYGSDAIAGVINIQLKENAEGGGVEARYGEYAAGDGALKQVAGNVGMALGATGFLNLSAEYKSVGPTSRSVQRANATALRELGYPVRDPVQIWGSPDIDYSLNTFYNLAVGLGGTAEFYSFGNYAERNVEGGFFFRAPGGSSARNGVFRTGSERLVADLAPNDDFDCVSSVPDLSATFAVVDDFVANTRGKCFLFNERFPGGFTPRFGADISDFGTVAGIRGETTGGLRWDLSVSAGKSDVEFFMRNTINASLGPETPTEFNPRTYTQKEKSLQIDVSYPIQVRGFYSPLNLAAGFEWRNERFEIGAGDRASYIIGPYANGEISDSFSIGSNGFQGLNPKNAGAWDRPNYAVYVDLETDLTEKFLIGAAARFEDFYDDFGDTINGKVSMRWWVFDELALRGTFGTGFRAPSPGQSNVSLLSTTFSGTGTLAEVGTVAPYNPVAQAFGGGILNEEKSRGFSLGFIYEFTDQMHLRADFYNIVIKDRIARTGNISITEEVAALLEASGLAAGGEVQNINFFTNDFDTTTRGINVEFDYTVDWNVGRTEATLGWNWTENSLDDFSPPRDVTTVLGQALETPLTVSLLTKRRRVELEDINPAHRIGATLSHAFSKWRTLLRGSYFSGWEACRFQGGSCANLDSFEGAFLVDGEISYRVEDRYYVSLGVQNLFDKSPGSVREEGLGQGNAQPASAPYDYNGRFLYVTLGYQF